VPFAPPAASRTRPALTKLCRLLGFGLLAVTASNNVEVVAEPAPWRPKRNAKCRSAIVVPITDAVGAIGLSEAAPAQRGGSRLSTVAFQQLHRWYPMAQQRDRCC
jgi:hypothetical protein